MVGGSVARSSVEKTIGHARSLKNGRHLEVLEIMVIVTWTRGVWLQDGGDLQRLWSGLWPHKQDMAGGEWRGVHRERSNRWRFRLCSNAYVFLCAGVLCMSINLPETPAENMPVWLNLAHLLDRFWCSCLVICRVPFLLDWSRKDHGRCEAFIHVGF